MTFRQRKTVVYAVISFLAAVGVFLDVITPLGITDWVWYFIPLLLSVYIGSRSLTFVLAAVFSLLTLMGFFLSPPGIDPQLALASRLMGVCVQWLMAYMLWRRKSTEEKNLQLAAIVNSSDDAIIGKTLDGIITSWNRGAEKIYGYTEAEVVGKPITVLMPAGHENEMPLLVERIRRGEQVEHYETLRQRKDGTLINVSLTVSPVKNIEGETVGASVVARDITLRKRADETLQKSEQKYRELVEHANSVIVRWKHTGEITFLNEFGQKFFGYSASEILGRHVVGTIVPETESTGRNLGPLMDQIRDDPKAFEQNVNENMRRNGERVWIAWTNKAAFDEQGQVREILSIGTDITERNRAEKALRQSQEEFKDLFDNAPVGFHEVDAEGRVVRINNTELKMLGYTAEELLGQFVWKISAEEEISRRAALAKLSGERPPQAFKRNFRRKDGSVFPVLINDRILKREDGTIIGIRAAIQNITELERAEAALATEQQLLNSLIAATPDHIYFKDRQSRFTRINESFARRQGFSDPDAILGKTDFDIFGEQHARQAYEDEQRIIATGQPMIGKEEREDWKDGHVTWVSTTKMPLRDTTGKIVGIMGISRDITARKLAEEAQREAMALYYSLVEQMPAGVFRKDRAGRYIFVNSWFCQLRSLEADQILGRTPDELLAVEAATRGQTHPEILQLLHDGSKHHEEIMRTGKPIHVEEIYPTTDGASRYLHVVKSAVFGPDAKIVGTQGIEFDVTDLKQMERQLAETLDFSQKIISKASVGIIVYKASGQCVLANEAAARTLNATVPELLKQNFRQIQSWRDSGLLPIAEETLAGKPRFGEFHFTSTFGKEAWLLCHFSSFVRGNEPHLLLLFNDIIERKRAEEHIREQATLLDKAQDAIMVLDLDDHIVFWNKSAERIYGWSAAEAIGKKPLNLFLGGAVSPRHAEAIKTIQERGEWGGELQEVNKEGRAVTVQGRCNVIYNERGQPKARLIINTDVTERKKLEAQFLRAQRMESLGTLAGGIAHDLNNVLTPLLISVQVLKEKVTDDDGKRLVASLEANVQRGSGLVKQVLAFGRGVEGERIIVQPKHIAREIKQMINETFPKSVAFELHSAPDLCTITGDPTQLHQILLNLCVNARDAMPKGGKLSLRLENVVLDEAYASMNLEARPGPYLCLTVKDTGTGMPKEIQEKIFDPFFTTKEPGKGTGLGLSTTLAIVKSHGGFIHCYSEPGKGSTFKVYLPANPALVSAENVVTEKARLPNGRNNLVLVVDDEEPIRKLAQRTLERYGYRVLLAADGTEALSLYRPRQNEIDVVITDMMMPKMDGLATISALKSINPNIKIIGSSGLASDGGVTKAMAAGIQHFIPKPYTAETMLLTLNDVLNGNGKH